MSFLPLSFLMLSSNSKLDFEVPRNSGSCGFSVSFAGTSVASFTAMGSVALTVGPFASRFSVVVPVGASLGTSRRSSNDTLEFVAGSAAAIG